MKIGCPKEIKNNENRIGLTPNAASAYIAAGHQVFIEKNAGLGSSIPDEEYVKVGAKILPDAKSVWAEADMIVKVKEPLESEYPLMRENQLIYTYFHFAADEALTKACLEKKIIGLAYETVEEDRALPLLKPMSEVAGRMAALMGAFYSGKTQGGRGLLPMGVTGVAPAEVLVLGGGIVGTNAARVAAGLGCTVTILDLNLKRLDYLNDVMPANVTSVYSDPVALDTKLRTADIVVGAVLVPGAVAPKLVRRHHLKIMKPGAVMVDVAIDQGGCFETSHATTHTDPIFVEDGIIHYCVANMPGAYARTATYALNNATIRFGLMLANKGAEKACRENAALKLGLNVYKGLITYKPVAEAFAGMEKLYKPVDEAIA
ncbi:MAG: alanine dehydrogenase [Deltaproteobacteria bacterium]|jgi:alanine dehydrogenase|nr:alanine dehydrogenase [Deltaproteobacteria bacterium]